MQLLKKVFDFYIHASIHVALAVFSLIRVTEIVFNIGIHASVSLFGFFGTIVGYNFIKYYSLVRLHKNDIKFTLRLIVFVSFLAFIGALYYGYKLSFPARIIIIGTMFVVVLYTLPFLKGGKNLRNRSGIKVYIVSICWVMITFILPIVEANIQITADFYLKTVQQFTLILTLILIFEINDLKNDEPHLQTIPQKIGVKNTKKLAFALILIFCLLETFSTHIMGDLHLLNMRFPSQYAIATLLSFLTYHANENKSKYYTSFWTESIPIVWMILLLIFN